MSFKEWNAVILLVGQVVVTLWLVVDAMQPGAAVGLAAVAGKLVWAIVFMIVFNIVAAIVVSILVSIARREAFRDERADERDKAVNARAMRNSYVVASAGGALSLVLLALGFDPVVGAYTLFAALMLAGAADSVSQLVYYRLG